MEDYPIWFEVSRVKKSSRVPSCEKILVFSVRRRESAPSPVAHAIGLPVVHPPPSCPPASVPLSVRFVLASGGFGRCVVHSPPPPPKKAKKKRKCKSAPEKRKKLEDRLDVQMEMITTT